MRGNHSPGPGPSGDPPDTHTDANPYADANTDANADSHTHTGTHTDTWRLRDRRGQQTGEPEAGQQAERRDVFHRCRGRLGQVL